MNSPQESAQAPSLTLRDRIAVWRELVEQCGRKPVRKRVHALRVVTLRIQAELEHELSDLPPASHQAQAMLRFGKISDKLRQALGPVREFDVWLSKLQKLQASLGSTGYVPRSTRTCILQIERFEDELSKRRKAAAQKLTGQIAKRRRPLAEVGDDIDEFASDRRNAMDAAVAGTLLKQFGAISAEFAEFDEENLHDFRKRIKKVRYLAEIYQDVEPACRRIAAQIKKVHAAIGEWHDWQVLARIAKQGRHAEGDELREMLDSLAAESYEAAVAACYGIKARMREIEGRTSEPPSGIPRKMPARVSHAPVASLNKLA